MNINKKIYWEEALPSGIFSFVIRLREIFRPAGQIDRLDYVFNNILINIIGFCIGLFLVFILYLFIDINIWKTVKLNEIWVLGCIFIIPIGYFNVSKRINAINGRKVNKYINLLLFCILFIPFIKFIWLIYLLFTPSKVTNDTQILLNNQ